jgi:RHH-type proline utilization regulon transcriptional repressor/proline dehydrogenase/delta 1-pyrroline-5-carboxylate dehydrogenase
LATRCSRRALEAKGYRLSYDMLGEAARTERDALHYFDLYTNAIEAVGKSSGRLDRHHADALMARASVSVKLSALHPRFEAGKMGARLDAELLPRLVEIVRLAASLDVPVTFDAEEQDRLVGMLDLYAKVHETGGLGHWSGLGIAVQAYGKRTIPTLRRLARLARDTRRRIPVRLVKGAYWDSEIKFAQEAGLADYPVLTVKRHTDVSFLAGMRFLLADRDAFYAQLGTHNAHGIGAAIVAGGGGPFELQRLYGMGEALYEEVVGGRVRAPGGAPVACRIYAPVGPRTDLVAYLVRRLLENGANNSFVHRLSDDDVPVEDLSIDPVGIVAATLESDVGFVLPLPRPTDIHGGGMAGSVSLALTEPDVRAELTARMAEQLVDSFDVAPLVDGRDGGGTAEPQLVRCPHDRRERLWHGQGSNRRRYRVRAG